MNLQQLSSKLIKEALTTGIITLENGSTRELKATEILSLAKYVVSNNLVDSSEEDKEREETLPGEMLESLPLSKVVKLSLETFNTAITSDRNFFQQIEK